MPIDPDTVVVVGEGDDEITAYVLVDGYQKGIDRQGGPWRRVVYRVAGADSDAFMDLLMGIGNEPFPVGGAITFPQPHAYPGNDKLRCMGVTADPMGVIYPGPKLIDSEFCAVQAEYRVPLFDMDGTDVNNSLNGQAFPYSKVTIHGYTATEPVPPSVWVTKGENMTAGIPLDRKDSISYLSQDVNIGLYYRPYLADEFLNQFVNTLNASIFLGRPAGTWLFQDYSAEPNRDAQGNRYNDYNLPLKWREYDWNKKPMDDGSNHFVWERLWDGVRYKYPYKDWTPLQQFLQGNT